MVSTNINRKEQENRLKHGLNPTIHGQINHGFFSSWDHEIIGQRLRYWLSMYDFFGVNANEDFKKSF